MTAKSVPIVFVWTGGVMRPLPRYVGIANRQFGEAGTEHVLQPVAERSMASHNQYFAAVHDIWMNLPDDIAMQFPSAEHLRKRLLIAAGVCDERQIACANADMAAKTALFMREWDDFAAVAVHDTIVVVRRAKSQSTRAMGKQEFEASKKAVLEEAEKLIGVSRAEAMRNAGRSA